MHVAVAFETHIAHTLTKSNATWEMELRWRRSCWCCCCLFRHPKWAFLSIDRLLLTGNSQGCNKLSHCCCCCCICWNLIFSKCVKKRHGENGKQMKAISLTPNTEWIMLFLSLLWWILPPVSSATTTRHQPAKTDWLAGWLASMTISPQCLNWCLPGKMCCSEACHRQKQCWSRKGNGEWKRERERAYKGKDSAKWWQASMKHLWLSLRRDTTAVCWWWWWWWC